MRTQRAIWWVLAGVSTVFGLVGVCLNAPEALSFVALGVASLAMASKEDRK